MIKKANIVSKFKNFPTKILDNNNGITPSTMILRLNIGDESSSILPS